ncbi:MAG: hypothetical protein AB9866_23930 [Syntrophobacteraceae bacterium]
MEDDLILGLTRQVKEEVIENYVLERRILELQIEHLRGQAGEAIAYAGSAGKRLARLSFLMIRPEMKVRLQGVLGISKDCYWAACIDERLSRKLSLIEVRALTQKGKFRKLIVESYFRFDAWMREYRVQHEELAAECAAVNSNIASFQKNFDLLAILNFLRNLDLPSIEKKRILGDNFTAREMAELDKNLYIKPVSFEGLSVPAPLDLPATRLTEKKLAGLADEIYLKYREEAKKLLR